MPVGPLAIIRLLMAIDDFERVKGRSPYTREVLDLIHEWGYGEWIIQAAYDLGLIERYDDYCSRDVKRVCRFNKLSDRGRRFLESVSLIMSLSGVNE
ncbi:hypothetical protein [Caldivirga sp.]|uniref:hypothetical protein n=1 Tax=Caldivirga sp. TaxID=2080243 RepID=UPI0025C2A318|nr:hypothetical protein [Caldivirga sp.]